MEYQGWVNPYGANIGDLIARSGDAAAHAAEMTAAVNARAAAVKANAWGGAVQNIAAIPAQVTAARNAEVDQKLKQEALTQGIESRKAAQQQKIVTTIGRLAGGSKSADDFVSGVNDMAGLGALPPDVAKHIADQVKAAGPDGWAAMQGRYVDFGDQYEQTQKLGEKDRLVRGIKVVVPAEPTPMDLGPGHVAALPGVNGAPATVVASAPFAPGTGQHVINGQVVDATATPLGAPVPPQEKPSEVAVNNARVDQINKGIEETDAKLAGTVPMSDKDKQELVIQRARLSNEKAHLDAQASREDISSPKNQERLESSYAGTLKTAVASSRSGGLGLEDKKVDQARHLLTLLEQTKGKDGKFNLTAQQQTELSVGLATLLSPTGVPGEATVKSLTQATAEGDFGKVLGYLGSRPVAGTPDAVAKQLYETIERQGAQAETNREGHFNQIRALAPTDLAPARRESVEKALTNANRISVEVDGYRFPTKSAADAYLAAKAKR